jgi:hypothetical protein
MIPALLAVALMLALVATGAIATTEPGYAVMHRRTGEALGSALFVLLAWIAFRRPQMRKLAGGLALGTVLQGALGSVPLAHSLLAQSISAGTVALAVALSPGYARPPQPIQDYGWPSLRSLSVVLPALIAIQVALGAAFRHRLLGLMPHVIGAMLVSIFILVVGSFVLQQCKEHKTLSAAGRSMMVVTFVQVFLGLAVFTVRSLPQPEPSVILAFAAAHVVTGAALLGVSVALGMHIRRHVMPKG